MKLIIDIPEKVVTAIQNGEDYRYDIHTTIAQGIPYESKGDLISREALKDIAYINKGNFNTVEGIREWVDNAPTVFDCRSCKNNGNERECVDCHDYSNYVHYEKRPQGEWVATQVIGMSDITLTCSNCKDEFIGENDIDTWKSVYHYCPSCGAYMGGI